MLANVSVTTPFTTLPSRRTTFRHPGYPNLQAFETPWISKGASRWNHPRSCARVERDSNRMALCCFLHVLSTQHRLVLPSIFLVFLFPLRFFSSPWAPLTTFLCPPDTLPVLLCIRSPSFDIDKHDPLPASDLPFVYQQPCISISVYLSDHQPLSYIRLTHDTPLYILGGNSLDFDTFTHQF